MSNQATKEYKMNLLLMQTQSIDSSLFNFSFETQKMSATNLCSLNFKIQKSVKDN